MSWFDAIGNMLLSQQHARGQYEALEAEQRRQYDITRADLSGEYWSRLASRTGTYYKGAPLPNPHTPPPLFAKTSKCESCGSREWVAHDGKEVCAYCRGDRGVAVERPIPRPGFGNDPGPY